MTEFTAYVTQRIRYRVTGTYEKPEDFARAIDNGLWDDTDNEVEWDRVEVFDTDGRLVHDTKPEIDPDAAMNTAEAEAAGYNVNRAAKPEGEWIG